MGKLTPYLLLLGLPGLLPLLPAQQPVFRATTPLVQVPVTVADPKGQFVSTLQESEFQLRDNGILQNSGSSPKILQGQWLSLWSCKPAM